MKKLLPATILLSILLGSPLLAQSSPTPATPTAADMIRETKVKVLRQHLETALTEKLDLEKQRLIAPADQQETIKIKATALAKFCESLEQDLQQLQAPVPPPGPKLSPEALRKAAQAPLTKLQQWRTNQNSALRNAIVSLRQITAGNLKQLAASTDAAASTALLAEAQRLGILEPEDSLVTPPPSTKTLSLKGIWEHGLSPFRKGAWSTNGLGLQPDGTPHGTWTWLDESQGLFVVDDTNSQWMNLCRITEEDTVASVVMNGAQFKYKRKSPESPALPPLPSTCDLMTRLASAEKSLREQAALAWQQETERTVKTCESLLQELPDKDRAELTKALTLCQQETSLQSKTEPTPGLIGKWVIEGRTLEFAKAGIVLVNGEPKGQWRWGKTRSRGHIVFTLGAGQLTAIGNPSGDSMELQVIGAETKHAMKQ